MRDTGYSPNRARGHEFAESLVLAELNARGYDCVKLPVDGHRPDAQLANGSDYIEIKTSNGSDNLAIELDSIHTYRQIEATEPRRVYIIWPRSKSPKHWTVHTIDSLMSHIREGPRRHSGMGSNDDWYLFVAPPGTQFDEFFRFS